MKKKSSPGLVLLRYFSGILAALILFIALANFIAGGGGNPRIDEMGIAQDNGAMEGKEIRLGKHCSQLLTSSFEG